MSNERESSGAVLVDPLGGLVLDPANELRFKGPFDDYVTVSLTIRNPTEKRIAFKIKTTAPKRYCVKPNSGVLDSQQSMKVNVLLQPFNYDPNEKNKHKFMVQYLYLNQEEMQMTVNDILNTWKDLSPSRLLDLKLKCLFEFPEGDQQKLPVQQTQQAAPSTTTTQNDQSSKNSTTTTQRSTSNSRQVTSTSSTASDVYSATTDSTQHHSSGDFESTINTQSLTNTAPASSTVQSNTTKSYSPSQSTTVNNTNNSGNVQARLDKNENLQNELKQYKLENENLKKEIIRLREEETRLRKLALAPSSSSAGKVGSPESPLTDLLNNRLAMIIVLLIAIIVYLLLFR